MSKLFVFTVSLDEGVSELWHFRASHELAIAQFILDNPKTYADLLDYLPIGKKINKLTAATLLRLIHDSSIDGDSAYGFQIFELQEPDAIADVPDTPVETAEIVNPDFISTEQLKTLGDIEVLYQSEDPSFNALFDPTLTPLSESENHFIQQLSAQQRQARLHYTLRDEKSIFDFIAPIVFQIRQSIDRPFDAPNTFHNYPIQTQISETAISTHIDWMLYSGYESQPKPLFILEANWTRPMSVRDDRVILTKLLATLYQYPHLETLYGGYFWSSSSFHFCQLRRQPNGSFEFHTNRGLSTSHQVLEIYKAFKYLINLGLDSKNLS